MLYWSIYILYVLYVFPACRIILISTLLVLTALPCGTPSSLSNGQRRYSSTTVGSTVTYTCNTGYLRTAGSSSRTCLFGGRWSGSHPTCSSKLPATLHTLTRTLFMVFNTPCQSHGFSLCQSVPPKGSALKVSVPIERVHSTWFYGIVMRLQYSNYSACFF